MNRKISLSIVGGVFLFACILVSCYSAFRGIAFTDDGYSLLSAAHPEDIQINYNLAYLLTSVIYSWCGKNVGYFRLITVFINLFSCGILSVSVWYYTKKQLIAENTSSNGFIAFFLLYVTLSIAGSLIYMHNMNPDYNIPVRTIAILQGAIVICLFTERASSRFYLLCLTLGFLTGALFILRLPSFIFSFLLLLGIVSILRKDIISSMLFIIGVILFFVILIMARAPVMNYFDILKVGMKYAAGENHSFNVIIDNLKDIINSLLDSVVLFMIYYLWNKSGIFIKNRKIPLVIVISVILLYATVRAMLGGGDGEVTTILAIFNRAVVDCILICILDEYFYSPKTSDRFMKLLKNQRVQFTIFLLLISYSVSFGTATPLFYHTVFAFPLIVTVLIINLYSKLNNFTASFKFISYLCFLMFLIFVTGIIFYNANYDNLFRQDIPLNTGSGVIYIDKQTKADITELRESFLACGFKNGDYIISFYGLPSMIYLAGGRAAVTPWHFNVSTEWNEYLLNRMSYIESQQLFLLADEKRFNQKTNAQLLENFLPCSEFTFTGRSKFPVGKYIIFRHK